MKYNFDLYDNPYDYSKYLTEQEYIRKYYDMSKEEILKGKYYKEIDIKLLENKIKSLTNILTELEEWLNLEIAIHDEDDTIDKLYSCVLDKIQELKEKYK